MKYEFEDHTWEQWRNDSRPGLLYVHFHLEAFLRVESDTLSGGRRRKTLTSHTWRLGGRYALQCSDEEAVLNKGRDLLLELCHSYGDPEYCPQSRFQASWVDHDANGERTRRGYGGSTEEIRGLLNHKTMEFCAMEVDHRGRYDVRTHYIDLRDFARNLSEEPATKPPSIPMTAQEARELAQQRLKAKAIDHLYPIVKRAIEKAVNDGLFSVPDPLIGIRTPITSEQRQAVDAKLREEGYQITEVGPDFSGAKSCDYKVIQW